MDYIDQSASIDENLLSLEKDPAKLKVREVENRKKKEEREMLREGGKSEYLKVLMLPPGKQSTTLENNPC